jgi:hypothetical protein
MTSDQIEDVAREATLAALRVIDKATDGETNRQGGDCGDILAGDLHKRIAMALSLSCNRWSELWALPAGLVDNDHDGMA